MDTCPHSLNAAASTALSWPSTRRCNSRFRTWNRLGLGAVKALSSFRRLSVMAWNPAYR